MTIATLVYTWLNNKLMSAGNPINEDDESDDVFDADYVLVFLITLLPVDLLLSL